MSEVERIRLVRDGKQFRVEPAMPDELFINDDYGSVWLVKGSDYDTARARAEQAEAEVLKYKEMNRWYGDMQAKLNAAEAWCAALWKLYEECPNAGDDEGVMKWQYKVRDLRAKGNLGFK